MAAVGTPRSSRSELTMAGERFDDPLHFPDASAFRAWLAENHDRVDELWIGFYRKATGREGLGYPEALDELLCWGWIDGIRKKVDEERYTNRLTPRRDGSHWSERNRARYAELEAEGRVAPPGRAARQRFGNPEDRGEDGAPGAGPDGPREAREGPAAGGSGDRLGRRASTGAADPVLHDEHRARFQENPDAWAFHRAQPEGYRRMARRWISDAEREGTRLRRLDKLIRFAAAGERLPELEGRKTRDEP